MARFRRSVPRQRASAWGIDRRARCHHARKARRFKKWTARQARQALRDFVTGAAQCRAQTDQGQSNQRAWICAIDRLAQADAKTLAFETARAVQWLLLGYITFDGGLIERAKNYPCDIG